MNRPTKNARTHGKYESLCLSSARVRQRTSHLALSPSIEMSRYLICYPAPTPSRTIGMRLGLSSPTMTGSGTMARLFLDPPLTLGLLYLTTSTPVHTIALATAVSNFVDHRDHGVFAGVLRNRLLFSHERVQLVNALQSAITLPPLAARWYQTM